MPRCRVKHREKLYYTETGGEEAERDREEAGVKEGICERETQEERREVKRQILSEEGRNVRG